MRDGASACTDGVDVNHGRHYWIATNPGVSGGGFGELAVYNKTDIGRGAPHIKGDETFTVRTFPTHCSPENTGRWAR